LKHGGYTSVNNGGVWYLTPDASPSSGKYALQLYFTGFAGLADKHGLEFCADRMQAIMLPIGIVPTGSLIGVSKWFGKKSQRWFCKTK
jgi:hypothetical protein